MPPRVARRYYELTYDDNSAWATLADYAPDSFDPTPFWSDVRVDADVARRLVLVLSRYGDLPDRLSGPLSILVVSDRLARLIDGLGVPNQQFEPLLKREADEARIPGYSVVHVLDCVDCLDRSRSTFASGGACLKVVLDASRIPVGSHLFKVIDVPGALFVDDVFVAAVRAMKPVGIAVIEVES